MIVIVSSHLGVRVILPVGLSAARCVCTCSLQIWRRTPSYRSWVWTCTPSSCCLRSLFCLRPSPPSPETHGYADTYGSAAGSYTNRGGGWWQSNSIYRCEPLCGMKTGWMLRFNGWEVQGTLAETQAFETDDPSGLEMRNQPTDTAQRNPTSATCDHENREN